MHFENLFQLPFAIAKVVTAKDLLKLVYFPLIFQLVSAAFAFFVPSNNVAVFRVLRLKPGAQRREKSQNRLRGHFRLPRELLEGFGPRPR